MAISFVVAMSRNRVIGSENKLIWSLPADMQHFKEKTMGKPVIMGRKTHESVGRALPDRANIVITRDKGYKAKGCIVVNSMEAALDAAGHDDEVMVIGGAEIFRMFLPVADKIYLTIVEADLKGEVYFPELNKAEWKETEKFFREKDRDNKYDMTFITLERFDRALYC